MHSRTHGMGKRMSPCMSASAGIQLLDSVSRSRHRTKVQLTAAAPELHRARPIADYRAV